MKFKNLGMNNLQKLKVLQKILWKINRNQKLLSHKVKRQNNRQRVKEESRQSATFKVKIQKLQLVLDKAKIKRHQ